jgi:hypothetical protein
MLRKVRRTNPQFANLCCVRSGIQYSAILRCLRPEGDSCAGDSSMLERV